MTLEFFERNKDSICDTGTARVALAKTRLGVMLGFILVGYLAIALRLVDLTLLRAPEKTQTATATENIQPLAKPLRGKIVDRNGALVATSLSMASVYADTTVLKDAAATAAALAKILPEQKSAELKKKLSSGKKFVWIARDVTPRQLYAINLLGEPALGFQQEARRIYPDAGLAAHVTGYTDVDDRGISGIEKTFEAQLAAGEKPVRLSLDLRVQHTLRRELGEAIKKFSAKGAAGIVMDVTTGEIIALVSLPDFDPHHPTASADDARFNRASLGVFEMGSTFKLFSTAAALDSGKVQFGTTFNAVDPIKYGRFTITDFHAKNRVMTVPEIFIYSSNIGTARMAEAVGSESVQAFYRKLGFFEPAPVELPEKGAPLYPRPWRDISTLTTSFGHGIAISPLHLARAAAALVNGGTLVTPTLLKKENASLLPDGARVISTETSGKIRQLMQLVVAAGTGNNAFVEGYDVGGKTGTAEKNVNGRYVENALLSSFIGAFPMRHPQYVALAILDEPKPIKETYGYATGGWTAAPVVAKVIERMGPLYQIPPDFDNTHDITRDMAMYVKELKKGNGLAAAGADR